MTLIYFVLILGIIIFVHELGHFLFAKLFKVHVYEFSLGMGPRLFLFKRKHDETEYSIRLFPIGGYVRIAGEDDTEDSKIAEKNKITSKSWIQRFLVMFAGSAFNFIFAIIIIFTLAMTLGSVSTKPYIGEVVSGYPMASSGIDKGDLILKVDGKKVSSYDELAIQLYSKDSSTTFVVEKADKNIRIYKIKPILKNNVYTYGFKQSITKEYGIIESITYTGDKFIALIKSMWMSMSALITGGISLNQFSGPVGVYDMVGNEVASGIGNVAYFIAYLCINIGFINLLPIPALDGGRIFFLIIEKIKRSKVNPKVEAMVNFIGFILLMVLMVVVTFNDIFRLGG